MISWSNIRVSRIGVGFDEWFWESLIDGKVVVCGSTREGEAKAREKAEAALSRYVKSQSINNQRR